MGKENPRRHPIKELKGLRIELVGLSTLAVMLAGGVVFSTATRVENQDHNDEPNCFSRTFTDEELPPLPTDLQTEDGLSVTISNC